MGYGKRRQFSHMHIVMYCTIYRYRRRTGVEKEGEDEKEGNNEGMLLEK